MRFEFTVGHVSTGEILSAGTTTAANKPKAGGSSNPNPAS